MWKTEGPKEKTKEEKGKKKKKKTKITKISRVALLRTSARSTRVYVRTRFTSQLDLMSLGAKAGRYCKRKVREDKIPGGNKINT